MLNHSLCFRQTSCQSGSRNLCPSAAATSNERLNLKKKINRKKINNFINLIVHPTYSSSSISPNTVDLPVSQKFMMMGNRKKSSSSTAAATAAADTIGTSNNTSSSSSAVVKGLFFTTISIFVISKKNYFCLEPKTPSPHRSTSLNMADECGRKTAGIEQVSKPNAKKAGEYHL